MIKIGITSAEFSGLHDETRKALEENNCYILESVKYLLDESKVLKLFDRYGSEFFKDETKESWRGRWMDNNIKAKPIIIPDFKQGNSKHLLITILHEAHPYMKLTKIEPYIKLKWGIKAYHSDVTRYAKIPHQETNNIRDLLKSE